MSGLFGGKQKTKEESTSTEQVTRMPALNINSTTAGGSTSAVSVDPTTNRATASSGLGPNVGKYTDEYLGNSRDSLSRIEKTITKLQGNTNAYIQARVNPLKASLDSQGAANEREMARRGVFGSISQNESDNFQAQAQRQLGDARATALNESFSALFAAEAQARGVNADIGNAAQMTFQQELASLGLNLDALRISLGNQLVTSSTTDSKKETTKDDGSTWFTKLLSAAATVAAAYFTGGASLAVGALSNAPGDD